MKKCFKCEIEKPLTEYYKHPKTKDKHLNKCKDCTKKDSLLLYNKNMENEEWNKKERDRTIERTVRLNYRERFKPPPEKKDEAINKSNEKYPEKYKAKIASQRLKKEFENTQMHHWSYNEEDFKDCIELSVADHNLLHRFLIYDQESFYYKDLEGNLLDTKEKHLEYWYRIIEGE